MPPCASCLQALQKDRENLAAQLQAAGPEQVQRLFAEVAALRVAAAESGALREQAEHRQQQWQESERRAAAAAAVAARQGEEHAQVRLLPVISVRDALIPPASCQHDVLCEIRALSLTSAGPVYMILTYIHDSYMLVQAVRQLTEQRDAAQREATQAVAQVTALKAQLAAAEDAVKVRRASRSFCPSTHAHLATQN